MPLSALNLSDKIAISLWLLALVPSWLVRHAESRVKAAAPDGLPALIAAEINDPFQRPPIEDNLDPFERCAWWGRRGYGALDFPYRQPPLSSGQSAVSCLLLAAKPIGIESGGIAGSLVVAFLRDYLRYAMRIETPERSPEFLAMRCYLEAKAGCGWTALDEYVGDKPALPFSISEVTSSRSREFERAVALYSAVFRDSATAVRAEEIARHLEERATHGGTFHLWLMESCEPDREAAGIASFFTLPSAGFGGYLAFSPAARGRHHLRTVLRRVERCMLEDSGSGTGWYIECSDSETSAVFERRGFHELAFDYAQPPLPNEMKTAQEAVRLHLLYKDFGAALVEPRIERAQFAAALADIYRIVYRVAEPERTASYAQTLAQVRASNVPFRSPAANIS